jgi:hypothetical protein
MQPRGKYNAKLDVWNNALLREVSSQNDYNFLTKTFGRNIHHYQL